MSKKIKAIIVDDENKSREILKWMVEKYCKNVEILGLASSAAVSYTHLTLPTIYSV